LVSARLFWTSFAFAVVINLRRLLAQYFPEQFEAIVNDLDQTLRSIDEPRFWTVPLGQTIFLVSFLMLVIWSFVLLWGSSVQLREYFGIIETPNKSRRLSMTQRMFGNLLLANLCAGFVTFIAFTLIVSAYAWTRLGLERFSR
jgi:hypothetical protein